MPPRIERFQDQGLVSFAKEEVGKFRTGEMGRISSYKELGVKFGCSTATAFNYLNKKGMTEERRLIKKEIRSETLVPSPTLAWMIGVLAGGGEVRLRKGSERISLSSDDKVFLEKFKSTGEELFQSNAVTYKRYIQKGGKEYIQILFCNQKMALTLGNLSRIQWPHTICDRHDWIFKDRRYVWSFLEGLFEPRGSIIIKPKQRRRAIIFGTSYLHVANFIANLLVRVDVKNPMLVGCTRAREGISGVAIYNLPDIKIFVDNIHSQSPKKEERLELLRNLPRRVIPSNEEFIKEWVYLKDLLGRTPSFNEIQEFKKEGKTKYTPDAYSYRFGKRSKGKKSFKEARNNLEKIIREREEENN